MLKHFMAYKQDNITKLLYYVKIYLFVISYNVYKYVIINIELKLPYLT